MLRELHISGCIGCCKCLKESICNFQDDMTFLRDAIVKSRVLIFASPLYFCEVTGLMKNFLDRLYFFYQPVNKHLVAGKKVFVLTTLGEKKAGYETTVLEEFYRRFLRALDLTLVDMEYFPDLMEIDAINKKPEYVEKIFNIGQNLQDITR
jgi:multimeric flavodoxin WrbA